MTLNSAEACLREIEELRRSGASIALLHQVEQMAKEHDDHSGANEEIRELIALAWADSGNLETAACAMPLPSEGMSESQRARNQQAWSHIKDLAKEYEPLSDILQVRLSQAP